MRHGWHRAGGRPGERGENAARGRPHQVPMAPGAAGACHEHWPRPGRGPVAARQRRRGRQFPVPVSGELKPIPFRPATTAAGKNGSGEADDDGPARKPTGETGRPCQSFQARQLLPPACRQIPPGNTPHKNASRASWPGTPCPGVELAPRMVTAEQYERKPACRCSAIQWLGGQAGSAKPIPWRAQAVFPVEPRQLLAGLAHLRVAASAGRLIGYWVFLGKPLIGLVLGSITAIVSGAAQSYRLGKRRDAATTQCR